MSKCERCVVLVICIVFQSSYSYVQVRKKNPSRAAGCTLYTV